MPSSLIGVLQRYCEGIDSARPDLEPQQFTSLAWVLPTAADGRRLTAVRAR
ncbi:hypothetical protein ACFWAN_53000 [Streptomyces mirabilis]|uniref:hypothetical protein n=1 Tax=Streptomyces mirabilis TaxID=68239 RepID=UPI00365008E0